MRCVRCHTIWRAELTQAAKLTAAAEALAPEPPQPEAPIERAADGDVAAADGAADVAREVGWPDAPPAARPADRSVDAPAEAVAEPSNVDPSSNPGGAVEVEAPPLAPVDLDSGRPPIDIDPHRDAAANAQPGETETFAARRPRRGARRWRQLWSLSALQTAILILLIVDAILIGWRKDIVHVLPQTASLYAAMGLAVNLRGLSFDHVVTSTEVHEGVPILVVQGDIVNDTGAAVGVPRLRLAVRNAAKQEIYSWTTAPPRESLPPHEGVGFRTRLASPPPGSRDVLVRFLNRRDVVAEAR